MSSYSIAKVPGDGTGPEVVGEAVKVLDVAAEVHGFETDYNDVDLGGERYLRTNETLTGADLQAAPTPSSSAPSAIPGYRPVSSSRTSC